MSDLDGVETAELKEKAALIELFLFEVFFPLRCYKPWKVEIKRQRIEKKNF